MFSFPTYNITKAENDYEKLNIDNIKPEVFQPTKGFEDLREKLLHLQNNVYEEHNFDQTGIEKHKYELDLYFGIELYVYFNEIGITNRMAISDDFWRFLSIKVIPDVVHARQGFKEDYFYKKTRRIWLKTIYWYIHLSWMGDEQSTIDILKNNSTDTIMQLVDRISAFGYNVPLYREIMKQYSENDDRKAFRYVMILNNALSKVTLPNLHKGGLEAYVRYLYKEVD